VRLRDAPPDAVGRILPLRLCGVSDDAAALEARLDASAQSGAPATAAARADQ
jgi:hypothetical protein